jgi:hypothetical protein
MSHKIECDGCGETIAVDLSLGPEAPLPIIHRMELIEATNAEGSEFGCLMDFDVCHGCKSNVVAALTKIFGEKPARATGYEGDAGTEGL